MTEDESNLNNLAIAHYVVGGFGVLFGCFPLIHVMMGIAVMTTGFPIENTQFIPTDEANVEAVQVAENFNEMFGLIFVIVGGMMFLFLQAAAVCIIIAGRKLHQRKGYTYSFVIACILCAFFPFGTALGVLTILVLSKDSVKRIYGRPVATPSAPPPPISG